MKPSRVTLHTFNGIRIGVRHWGSEDAPKLFMLHGWMDIAGSFQFVVDELKKDWHVIAPDIRGFGDSQHVEGGYWFPDYLTDFECLLNEYSPDEPALVVGHSLGGYIATVYAGVRPHRVKRLVSLEGYGIIENHPKIAPDRLRRWLDSQLEEPSLRPYPSREALAARLMENNPRLTEARAYVLAGFWGAPDGTGTWRLKADPKHKRLPVLSRLDEVLACWRRITAPTLFIEGEHSLLGIRMKNQAGAQAEIRRRASHIADIRIEYVAGAGHMLQHDQPEAVAKLIDEFMGA